MKRSMVLFRRLLEVNGAWSAAQHGRCSMTTRRHFHRSTIVQGQSQNSKSGHIDVEELLSKPMWSVATLLPPKDTSPQTPEVTSKQLHHLLRLSALPPPKDRDEEKEMLSTLSSQLHFVKEIQKVDVTGVEPLRSLRDETAKGETEAELGMEALKEALAQEEILGKYHRRIRRRREPIAKRTEDQWDPLASAEKKVGPFFVVEGGKDG